MREDDTNWHAVYGYIPPRLDNTRFCPCPCHDVVRNSSGIVTREGRLGVLENETDYVCACGLCTIRHRKAVLRRRASEAA